MFTQKILKINRNERVIVTRSSADKPLELPGGGYWWLKGTTQKRNEHIRELHGPNFVLRRSKHRSSSSSTTTPGLVRQPPPFPPVPFNNQSTAVPPALSGVIVIDTSFQVIQEKEDEVEVQQSSPCLGIVPIPSSSTDTFTTPTTTDTDPSSSGHPRRTRKVRFTCNLCQSTNEKWVNPQAWSSGSVFVQCDGCTVVHKLIDNLNIFSELAGPVFPPVELRDTFLVQEVLDRIEKKRRNEMQ